MTGISMIWDVNLRANLRLWPSVPPNVQQLIPAMGELWDDSDLADRFLGNRSDSSRRAVRQTFEALQYEGLAYRDGSNRLRSTALGDYAFSFLGLQGARKFANEHNRVILAEPFVWGLSVLVEVRAIWDLMLRLDNRLSYEELNRAMRRITTLEDVPDAADAVAAARSARDPRLIGARIYGDADYGTSEETQQRRAMHPQFLLAGGAGTFIDDGPYRSILDDVVPIVQASLRVQDHRLRHAGTDSETALAISDASMLGRPIPVVA